MFKFQSCKMWKKWIVMASNCCKYGLTVNSYLCIPIKIIIIFFAGGSCEVSFELVNSAELGGNVDDPTLGSAVGSHDSI